eukprot:COSAG02_NODE_9074_length_2341_cov_4.429973_1_plen_579_part_10
MDQLQDIRPPSPRALLSLHKRDGNAASPLREMVLPHAMTPPPRTSWVSGSGSSPQSRVTRAIVEQRRPTNRRSAHAGAAAILQRLDEAVAAGSPVSPSRRRRLPQQHRDENMLQHAENSRARTQREGRSAPNSPTPTRLKPTSAREGRPQASMLQPVSSGCPTPQNSLVAAWPVSTGGSHWLRTGPIRWWSVVLRVGTAAAFAQWIAVTESSCNYLIIATKKLQLSQMQRAWRAFEQHIGYRRRINSLVHMALLTARSSLLFSALHLWADHCESHRQRRENVLRTAVGRMRLLYVAQSFVTWLHFCLRSQELMDIMVDAAPKIRGRRVGRAFDAWLDATDTMARLKAEAWPMYVDPDSTDTELVSNINEAQRTRYELLATQAARRWLHVELYAAVQRWTTFVQMEAGRRSIMLQVLARVTRRQVYEAFTEWGLVYCRAVDRQKRMVRVITHMSRRLLSLAYKRWLVHNTELVRSTMLAQKAVLQLSRSTLGRAHSRWLCYTSRSRILHVATLRCIRRRQLRLEAQSMEQLRSYASTHAKRRATLAMYLKELRHARVASAWRSWSVAVSEAVRVRTLLAR